MQARNVFTKFFLCGMLLLMLTVCAMPRSAEAITIRVQNRYDQKMWVSFVLYNDAQKIWEVRGWWEVTPKSTRDLDFNSSTKSSKVWIHAYTSEASWGGSGEEARRYTVISEVFRYQAGKTAPQGKGRRQVGFTRYIAGNNGIVVYRP